MGPKKTILVVDDEPDMATIISRILNSGGYRVLCIYNGREVFSRLQEERPDLIILDVKMPGMDGFEVLKRLKDEPESSSIPVILLTGKGHYQDILTGYELGTDYYMNKPFTSTQLICAIHLFLSDGNYQKSISGPIQ